MRILGAVRVFLAGIIVVATFGRSNAEPSAPPAPGPTVSEPTAPSAPPIAPDPPSDAELAAISNRGRLLAAYDQAAWHGTDAVQALDPDLERVAMYIARQDAPGKWRVVFGKRSEADDAFLVAYEAVQLGSPTEYAASAKNPPIADKDWFLRASRALTTAKDAVGSVSRPYNIAALPASISGDWFVYAYPAMTEEGHWPLGGDWRYAVSSDGRTITTTRQLHKTILEVGPPKEGVTKAGVHSHVIACIPEDTDVLAVLSRTPKVPEIIGCEPFMYTIETNGTVGFLGLTQELMKQKQKADPGDAKPPDPGAESHPGVSPPPAAAPEPKTPPPRS